MSTIIDQAKATLAAATSSAELEKTHAAVKLRIAEAAQRLSAITPRDANRFGSPPGPERQQVVATGDVEALRKLDEEVRDLGPELEVLRNLQGSLRQRLDEVRAREYVELMPNEFAELGELLAAEAEAQAAARKARQATAAQLKDIRAQRHHVARQNALNCQKLALPAAAPELLAQYMAVQGYTYHRGPERVGWFSPTGGPQELKNVAEALGVDVPRPDQKAAAA